MSRRAVSPAAGATEDLRMDDAALARRSDELADEGDWGAEALAVNRELAERAPAAAVARFRLALCFEEAGDVLAARTAFERFLAQRDRGLEARVARRRLAVCEERARAVTVSSPYEALARGRKHARAGRLDRARVWYEHAETIARRPRERAQALTGQASVLRTERRLADALRAAERAAAAQPSHAENMPAYPILIALLADLGRLDEAALEAEKLLAEKPRNRIANATAGRVYMELFKRTGDRAYRGRAIRCFAEARRGR
jgi:tetratricopeptide (TPR) repeat protein